MLWFVTMPPKTTVTPFARAFRSIGLGLQFGYLDSWGTQGVIPECSPTALRHGLQTGYLRVLTSTTVPLLRAPPPLLGKPRQTQAVWKRVNWVTKQSNKATNTNREVVVWKLPVNMVKRTINGAGRVAVSLDGCPRGRHAMNAVLLPVKALALGVQPC